MKRYITYIIIALFSSSCARSLHATYQTDDLYAPHSRQEMIAREEQRQRKAELVEQQRMEQWASVLGIDVDELARDDESYNTPYGERLRAISSDKYQKPAAYFKYQADETLRQLAQYDPDQYTATISNGGQISVEPKYSNSIYGVWGSPYYSHYYGWNYGYYNRFYSPYYYSPYYYSPYSYYDPYYYNSYHYNPYYRPYHHYRPKYYYSSSRKQSIVRPANPYQAPSKTVYDNRRSNGSTVGRSSSSYNRSSVSRSSSYTTRTQSTPSTSTSRPVSNLNSIGR